MYQHTDFKNLAQKAYLSYHQDGIIDLIIGWVALFFGLNMITENSTFLFVSWLAFIMYMPLKNRFTVPRFGYINFDSKVSRRATIIVTFLVLGVLVLFVFGIAVLLISGSPPPPTCCTRRRRTVTAWPPACVARPSWSGW